MVVEFTRDFAYDSGKGRNDVFAFSDTDSSGESLVDAKINGKFVTLIFADGAPTAGDTLTVKTTNVCDADHASNVGASDESAVTLVAGTTEYDY